MVNKAGVFGCSSQKSVGWSRLLLVLLCLVIATGCKRKEPASSPAAAGQEKAVTKAKADGPDHKKKGPNSYTATLFKDDPDSYKEYQEIQKDLRSAKYASASKRLEKLHQSSPQAPWAEMIKFQRIQALRLGSDLAGALQVCREFIQSYPASTMIPQVRVAEGEIYAGMAKQVAAEDGGDEASSRYHEKALEIFRLVSNQYPQFRDQATYRQGTVYISMGDYGQAKELFRTLASEKQKSAYAPKALYSLAVIYLGQAEVADAQQTYQELVDRFPEDRLAKKAKEKLKGLALVGQKAPSLKIKEWIGDAPDKVEAYEKKLTIISFWGIWCGHCRKNLPKMNRLADTLVSQGVALFGISREKGKNDAEKIRSFIKMNPMKFPTAVDDDGRTSDAFSVKNLPCLVIVDGQGQICWYGHPDFLTDEVISVLLRNSL